MGVVLENGTVCAVLVVFDGRINVYGHTLFANVEDANKLKDEAVASGIYDQVYVTRFDVI